MTYGNSKLQTIYNYGPTWLKNMFVSLYGWREQKRRYGNAFTLLKSHSYVQYILFPNANGCF